MEFNLLQSMSDNSFPELELLILYPRMASYNNFYTGEIELAFTGTVVTKFGYDAEMRTFLIPNDDFTWVFEFNPKLYLELAEFKSIYKELKKYKGNISDIEQLIINGFMNLVIANSIEEIENATNHKKLNLGSGYDSGDIFLIREN